MFFPFRVAECAFQDTKYTFQDMEQNFLRYIYTSFPPTFFGKDTSALVLAYY